MPASKTKKHRKHGRVTDRPAHKRYNEAQRWEKNKARRAAARLKRIARRVAKRGKYVYKKKPDNHPWLKELMAQRVERVANYFNIERLLARYG